MKVTYRCWAEIDLDALRQNLSWIRHRVGAGVKILTVVKADAYGHGLKQIAAHLMRSGTDLFGVANLAEARQIHQVGQGWPILMLGAALPEEVEEAVREDVMATVSTWEEGRWFSAAATKLRRTAGLQLKVDTGMGRLGAKPEEAAALLRRLEKLPSTRVRGLYTHFASAEEDPRFTLLQRRRFERVLLEIGGRSLEFVHANNSAAVLLESGSGFNTIRPGLLVYGIIPPGLQRVRSDLAQQVQPALSWKARVGFVKQVPPRTPLSYGSRFKTRRPMKVATITAGYGDGYPRSAAGQAQVLIGGRPCPVVGMITMDQMLVDVSSLRTVRPGAEVVLLGAQGQQAICATQLAAWAETISWEILTGISYRVPRVYRGGAAS